MKLFVALISALISFNSGKAHAQSRSTMTDGFQVALTGASSASRDEVIKRLLTSEDAGFSWPSFPRTWHEQSEIDSVTTNVGIGLSLNKLVPGSTAIGNIGAKYDIEFKYGIKSTLFIALPRKIEVNTELGKKELIAPDSQVAEMVRFDRDKMRSYPNVTHGIPMVGFCVFEASFAFTQTQSGNLDFLVFSSGTGKSKVRQFSHSMFSQFFQIDDSMSPFQIHEEICSKKFKEMVRKHVEADFSRVLLEFQANYSVLNVCKKNPGQDNDEQGDADCQKWRDLNFPRGYKNAGIPRCILSQDGVHRCALRAKPGGNCPMVFDRKANILKPGQIFAGKEMQYAATRGSPFELQCDESRGLECRADAQPKSYLNGLIVSVPQGTCR